MNRIDTKIGMFVHYADKNELGLIGLTNNTGAACWFNIGGVRAMTDYEDIEPLTLNNVLSMTFSNEGCKGSLIERRIRLANDEDTSDLIDGKSIRNSIKLSLFAIKQCTTSAFDLTCEINNAWRSIGQEANLWDM